MGASQKLDEGVDIRVADQSHAIATLHFDDSVRHDRHAGALQPSRLTYHPADRDDVGWTPDGKRILSSSSRAAFARGVVQLFTVPLEGGFATQVRLARASEASFSPDGARIAYVPNIQSRLPEKRRALARTHPADQGRAAPRPNSRAKEQTKACAGTKPRSLSAPTLGRVTGNP